MPTELEKHHTQRAAERATEAELNRRAIATAKTDGNQPGIDLIAIHPNGRLTPIEVKGKHTRHGDWFIAEPKRPDTVYVLVYVPTDHVDKPGAFQFFLMTAAEVRKAMKRYLAERRRKGVSDETWRPAIRWQDALGHKNCWDRLNEP